MARRTIKLLNVAFLLVVVASSAGSAQTPEKLYEAKCGRCHSLYSPESFPAEDWPGIIRSMRAQSGLTEVQEARITEYVVQSAQAGGGDGGGPEAPALGGYLYTEFFQDEQKAKNFDLHYLAVSVSGWASETIQYLAEFELEHGGKGDNTFVEQAYVDFFFTQNLGLKIGGILPPFNRFDELHDPLNNYTISRPQVAREIGVSAWKDVGLVLHGFTDLGSDISAFLDVYTVNGLGDGANLRGSRQYRDNNEDRAVGGRANFVLFDVVDVGGSAYHGAWDDGGDYDLTMFGGFVMARTPVADFWAEYFDAKTENPGPDDDGDMSGYFVQASRLFGNRFRPTVRVGALDYLDPGTQLGRDPTKGDKDVTEVVLSFGYYPTSKVVLKAEYIIFGEGDRMEDVDNNLFGLQAAVKF